MLCLVGQFLRCGVAGGGMSNENVLTFYTRVADYCATGEGLTVAIVIAPTAGAAERIMVKQFGHWLNAGAESFVGIEHRYAKWIPQPVVALAETTPNFVWHSHLHFNLS